MGKDACIEAHIESIARKEMRLREGQAHDALHQLRLAIGHKSFLFRKRLRNAKSKTRKTRAWDDINAVGNTVSHQRRVYHSARNALIALGASKQTLAEYQQISSAETRSSTVIIDPNARGQRNTGLPWFWGHLSNSGRASSADGSPLMTECKCHADAGMFTDLPSVYRVHWLRAHARHERWKEEWELTSHEMGWTVNFFAHKASTWHRWAEKARFDLRFGHECYALKQRAFWLSMKDNALTFFQRAILTVNKDESVGEIPGLDPRHSNRSSAGAESRHDGGGESTGNESGAEDNNNSGDPAGDSSGDESEADNAEDNNDSESPAGVSSGDESEADDAERPAGIPR